MRSSNRLVSITNEEEPKSEPPEERDAPASHGKRETLFDLRDKKRDFNRDPSDSSVR